MLGGIGLELVESVPTKKIVNAFDGSDRVLLKCVCLYHFLWNPSLTDFFWGKDMLMMMGGDEYPKRAIGDGRPVVRWASKKVVVGPAELWSETVVPHAEGSYHYLASCSGDLTISSQQTISQSRIQTPIILAVGGFHPKPSNRISATSLWDEKIFCYYQKRQSWAGGNSLRIGGQSSTQAIVACIQEGGSGGGQMVIFKRSAVGNSQHGQVVISAERAVVTLLSKTWPLLQRMMMMKMMIYILWWSVCLFVTKNEHFLVGFHGFSR